MKEFNKRVRCNDGTSLSVQANQYVYCEPRTDDLSHWSDYLKVEVGYIYDADDNSLTPPNDWQEYADGVFPSDVYGYVPTDLVLAFIADHGGEVQ